MGDLLFAIANLSRKLGIEPETALRKANDKFTTRFTAMERAIAASGRAMKEMTLDELEAEWQSQARASRLDSRATKTRKHETKHSQDDSLYAVRQKRNVEIHQQARPSVSTTRR